MSSPEDFIIENGVLKEYTGSDGYVVIPDGVTEICSYAFAFDHDNLTHLVIPDSVAKIGYSAFMSCTNLTHIEIPASVTVINRHAFDYCDALGGFAGIKDIINPDNFVSDSAFAEYKDFVIKHSELLEYSGSENHVVIPNGVTKISDGLFEDCKDLEEVIIPDSVTTIGDNTFSGCSKLKNVKLPNSITTIGSYAFCGCSCLTHIEIPNSVTEIGSDAFEGCTGLTHIEIPNSVTEIGNHAFSGCTGLTHIELPDSVTKIGNHAFQACKGLTEINIPDSVTTIGNRAFYSCTELTHIVIPNSVTKIGDNAFDGCTNLSDIVRLENSVGDLYFKEFTGFEIESGVMAKYTGSEENVTIPDGVIEIGEEAFKDCTNLKSVEMPNSVTRIGWGAFSGCTGLTEITIPNSVTEIDEGAFYGCTGLTHLEIPNSVTEIGYQAFEYCTGLTRVEIPNSVTKISDSAFYDCIGLKEVIIKDGVTEIEKCAFWGCTELTRVEIPNSVTKIDNCAFSDCTNLTHIKIPNNSVEIDDCAFEDCTTVEIGGTTIGVDDEESWYDTETCDESNEDEGFDSNAGFGLLNAFKVVGLYSEVGDFEYEPASKSDFIIRNGVVEKYIGTKTRFSIPEGVTEIGEDAFSLNDNIEAVKIPEGVTKLAYNSFATCRGLVNVKLPSTLKEIGDYSFMYCTLQELEIPEGLERIGDNAFQNCRSIHDLVIPESVEYIGDYAFSAMGASLLGSDNSGATVHLHENLRPFVEKKDLTGSTKINFEFYGVKTKELYDDSFDESRNISMAGQRVHNPAKSYSHATDDSIPEGVVLDLPEGYVYEYDEEDNSATIDYGQKYDESGNLICERSFIFSVANDKKGLKNFIEFGEEYYASVGGKSKTRFFNGSYDAAIIKGSQLSKRIFIPMTEFGTMYMAQVEDDMLLGIGDFSYSEDNLEYYECFLTVVKSISYKGNKIFEGGITPEELIDEFALGEIE